MKQNLEKPAIGKMAPLFTALTAEGKEFRLRDMRGSKLALYFYPQSDTPTCTTQACNLRDNYAELKKQKIEIVGISPDAVKKQLRFTDKFQLPFTLLADEDSSIAIKYGVWGPKQFMGRNYIGLHRTTFLINEQGRLVHIIDKPVSKDHASQIAEGFMQHTKSK